jgi:pimeloyl-ACP methyl ester carboxylesterase
MQSITPLPGTATHDVHTPPADPEVREIAIGQHKIRVLTAGKDHLATGIPTVAFENGLGSQIEDWGGLPARVARFAPVVAYDRPGIGGSQPARFEPSPENVADLLHSTLAGLGVQPPVVLVGFSLGGPYVRMFAARYQQEVAGIVYIDPEDFTETRQDALQVFTEMGIGAEGLREYEQKLDAFVRETSDESSVTEWQQALRLRQDGFVQFNLQAPPLPVPQVLLASTKDQPPFEKFTFDFQRWARLSRERRTARFMSWVMSLEEGHFVATPSSPHKIHGDDPDLVVWAIRRVMFPDLSRRLSRLLRAIDEQTFLAQYNRLKSAYPPEALSEDILNSIGYELLLEGSLEKALVAFRLNVAEYPTAGNPYDSLAEAYMVQGNTELSILNYKRSLELDPKNRNAENKLSTLES